MDITGGRTFLYHHDKNNKLTSLNNINPYNFIKYKNKNKILDKIIDDQILNNTINNDIIFNLILEYKRVKYPL